MKIYIYQGLNVIFSLLRVFLILKIGGTNLLGVFGLLTSSILFMSFLSQVIANNQGLQIGLMSIVKRRQTEALRFLFLGMTALIVFESILYLFIEHLFFLDGIQMRLFSFSLISSSLLSVVSSVFDLKTILRKRLDILYQGNLVGVFFGLICLVVFRRNAETFVYIIPVLTAFGSVIFYFIVYYEDIYGWRKVALRLSSIKFTYKIIRQTLALSLIPFFTVSGDYFFRVLIVRFGGLIVLGHFQFIVSIEGMIGNMLFGPFNRSMLYLNNAANDAKYFSSLFIKVILLSSVPLVGSILIVLSGNLFGISNDYIMLFKVITVVILLRIPWNFWGVLGQLLMHKNKYKFVLFIETAFRILSLVMTIVILCFFLHSIWSYPLGLFLGSLLMSLLIFFKIKNILVLG